MRTFTLNIAITGREQVITITASKVSKGSHYYTFYLEDRPIAWVPSRIVIEIHSNESTSQNHV